MSFLDLLFSSRSIDGSPVSPAVFGAFGGRSGARDDARRERVRRRLRRAEDEATVFDAYRRWGIR